MEDNSVLKQYQRISAAMEQLCSQAAMLTEKHKLLLQRNAELVKLTAEQNAVVQSLSSVGALKPRPHWQWQETSVYFACCTCGAEVVLLAELREENVLRKIENSQLSAQS